MASEDCARRRIETGGVGLLILALLPGLLHLVVPAYRWGQGRGSYFDLAAGQTLGSWMATMLLVAAALTAAGVYLLERDRRDRFIWLVAAGVLATLSFCEFTRLPTRLGWFGTGQSLRATDWLRLLRGPGHLLVAGAILLALGVVWARCRFRDCPLASSAVRAWAACWTVALLTHVLPLDSWLAWRPLHYAFLQKECLLVGTVALLMALAEYLVHVARPLPATGASSEPSVTPTDRRCPLLLLLGVFGTAAVVIVFEIVLLQILSTFGTYLTAHAAISVALLGLTVGGLLGYGLRRAPAVTVMAASAAILPFVLPLALGAVTLHREWPTAAALLLTLPYVAGGITLTTALSWAPSHRVYFADLVGAGCGALCANTLVSRLLEENAVFALAGIAALCAVCFLQLRPAGTRRLVATVAATATAMFFFVVAALNLRHGAIDIVRARERLYHPQARVVETGTSLLGRVAVVEREPGNLYYKLLENGRTIDTLRPLPTKSYVFDPRLPRGLVDTPRVLIIGVSGEGITKTAKNLGGEVHGVEINPAVVKIMRGPLRSLTYDPHGGIDVAVMDARSYLENDTRSYEFITLLNTHFARGPAADRAACPELLYTVEALRACFDHLTDRGYLVLEEPVEDTGREPPVWKLLVTLREMLLEAGVTAPERHFLCFYWATNANRYVQILVKKTPVTEDEVDRYHEWLLACNNVRELGDRAGRRMGPILTAHCQDLYVPGDSRSNNVARAVRGVLTPATTQAYMLHPARDDRPYLFDVAPDRPGLRRAYARTALLVALVSPFLFIAAWRQRRKGKGLTVSFLLTSALTGLGYLLVQVILMQRYALYLGSPIVAFSAVLGSMLLFSGLGSLFSARLEWRGVAVSSVGIAGAATLLVALFPRLAAATSGLSLAAKAAVSVGTVAPLCFCMGIPFAFLLRAAKTRFEPAAAAMMFAANGLAGALAVPLALYLTTSLGFTRASGLGVLAYGLVALVAAAATKRRAIPLANAVAGVALAAVLLSPWLAELGSSGPSGGCEAYAIRYGRSQWNRAQAVAGVAARRIDFDWYAWLVRDGDRVVLVDTGFDSTAVADAKGFSRFNPVHDRLKILGLAPEDITDVVLTHLHWDHAGALGRYPQATVWIQRSEFEHAAATLSPEQPARHGMRYADLQVLLQRQQAGTLRLLDGEAEISPGIRAHWAGDHTPGSQYLTLETVTGGLVLAGDSCVLYENVLKGRALASAPSATANLRNIRAMVREAASPLYVVPGHDPRVRRYFPRVHHDIVRLDRCR